MMSTSMSHTEVSRPYHHIVANFLHTDVKVVYYLLKNTPEIRMPGHLTESQIYTHYSPLK